MLTAHECIGVLAALRSAEPRVRYRWPLTPESVSINAGRLSFWIGELNPGRWSGNAVLDGRDDDEDIWPPELAERFHDEVDAVLARAGVEARVVRPMSCGIPF